MSRVIAIGDIHGCSVALSRLLEMIQPASDDTIVGLGDYVDRGVNSAAVLESLVELVGKCRFVPLIGNHEVMMFRALRDPREVDFWFTHGGDRTLASYGGRVANVPQHHRTFLGHCLRYFETPTHIFVHASYVPDVPMQNQPDEVIFWEHINEFVPSPHISGKTFVVGHTPQMDGMVRNLGHIQIIDTWCYGGGWLTALDVASGRLWQANNEGETRELDLPPPETVSREFDGQ